MSRYRFVVGLDYGTTFSGISYVTTDKKTLEDIHVIRSWPGKDGEWKTPSRIAYARENQKLELEDDLWGFQTYAPMTMCSWTKLLLDKDSKIASSDDQGLDEAVQSGKFRLPSHRDAKGVVTDFLHQLWKYLEQKLRREVGDAIFNSTPMDVWLTVPAVWSDQAKDATVEAAREAGFGAREEDTISLIGEPEAAAIAVLNEISNSSVVNKLIPGETVLVCDCGGGTVDITSYNIAKVGPVPQFEEVCVGVGAKYGATSIDRAFHELMKDRFGAAWERIEDRKKGPGSEFMDKWERIKRQFGGIGDERMQQIQLVMKGVSDSQHYDEEEASVKLSKKDVQLTFDPTIRAIIRLIDQQHQAIKAKEKTVSRLIMVGGFSESIYLYNKVKEWCSINGNIQCYCQVDPQAAIVRGAALCGLLDTASLERKCRRYYGCGFSLEFREGVDSESDAFYREGKKLCSSRVEWIIHKGATITKDTKVSKEAESWVQPAPKNSKNTFPVLETVPWPLYTYNGDDPPDRINDSVHRVGVIITDPNIADSSLLAESLTWVPGEKRYKFSHKLEIDFGARDGMLRARNTLKGVVIGNTEIRFT